MLVVETVYALRYISNLDPGPTNLQDSCGTCSGVFRFPLSSGYAGAMNNRWCIAENPRHSGKKLARSVSVSVCVCVCVWVWVWVWVGGCGGFGMQLTQRGAILYSAYFVGQGPMNKSRTNASRALLGLPRCRCSHACSAVMVP